MTMRHLTRRAALAAGGLAALAAPAQRSNEWQRTHKHTAMMRARGCGR